MFDCTNKCMFEFQSIYSCAGGIGYRSGAPEFNPVYNGVRVAWSLRFFAKFYRSLFVLLSFFGHCIFCPSSMCGFVLPFQSFRPPRCCIVIRFPNTYLQPLISINALVFSQLQLHEDSTLHWIACPFRFFIFRWFDRVDVSVIQQYKDATKHVGLVQRW